MYKQEQQGLMIEGSPTVTARADVSTMSSGTPWRPWKLLTYWLCMVILKAVVFFGVRGIVDGLMGDGVVMGSMW
jgi:hypothetical protein